MYLSRVLLSSALTFAVITQARPATNNIAQRLESALASLFIPNIDNVAGNLHLPKTLDGFNVSWISNNLSVISQDGLVTRPTEDSQIILRARVDHEGAHREREYVASVKRAVQLDCFTGYAFAYFTGNSKEGENIFFAATNGNNALDWRELNNGQPALTSSMGTKGLRDPFIIRSAEGDKFFLLATDLSIGSGTSWSDSVKFGSRYLEVWESNDLKTWSAQRHVLVSPPEAGNTWAPEAFYDSSIGEYVVYWASSLYADDDPDRIGATYHRMLYSTTRDFVKFSETSVWQDAGKSRIDSTVIEVGDVYYRFTKDEGAAETGCTDIIQERSDSLRSDLSQWTQIASCIGKNAGTSAVEGPTSFRSNPGDVNGDKFYLFVDEYGDRGYIPLETADVANPQWKVSSSYKLPSSPRHGTVIGITAAELESLTSTT